VRFVVFTHSLVSDWNHGNAHFLRGVATEWIARGHEVAIYEPANGWSRRNMLDQDPTALRGFEQAYPCLRSRMYDEDTLDLERAVAGAGVVLVHEWNSQSLVAALGRLRERDGSFRLFFHDTHHRSISDPESMAGYDLRHYDGVLAYGEVLRGLYRDRRWTNQAWTWHEAADIRVFYPRPASAPEGDLVWIGNWGDGERREEIREFLIGPVKSLGLKARVYGVRYPPQALKELAEAGIEYGGWLPNYRVPEVFARFRATVHIPRRPYSTALPGIPTIRPFEALACGIPLISAPWLDSEHLFRPGLDFLFAANGREMTSLLRLVLSDRELARDLAAHGLATIRSRHTCSHRVEELMTIAHRASRFAAGKGAR
jgi:spore maturation protein CgeB